MALPAVPDDAPGIALYMWLAPFAIVGLPVAATLLGLWCLLRNRRDRLYAASAIFCCATVLLLVGVVTPWVTTMPEQVVRMVVYPESLDPTPDLIQWVRGQKHELVSLLSVSS